MTNAYKFWPGGCYLQSAVAASGSQSQDIIDSYFNHLITDAAGPLTKDLSGHYSDYSWDPNGFLMLSYDGKFAAPIRAIPDQ